MRVGQVPTSPRETLLVIAPHPDDEVLMAGQAIVMAKRAGMTVKVAIITNGDFTCARDGYLRERESVAALKSLGVGESDVEFLGYPDGYLASLGDEPLPAVERIQPNGRCGKGAWTYAQRGARQRDANGSGSNWSRAFTAGNLVADLEDVLERNNPSLVVISHGIDHHPDHAATYKFYRQALDRRNRTIPTLRSIVHHGSCWPNDSKGSESCDTEPYQPQRPLPKLPPPWDVYVGRKFPVGVPLEPSEASWRKMNAIREFPSQTGAIPERDWLSSFARTNEFFFPEFFECSSMNFHQVATPRHQSSLDCPNAGLSNEGPLLNSGECTDATPWTLSFRMAQASPESEPIRLNIPFAGSYEYRLTFAPKGHYVELARVSRTSPSVRLELGRVPLPRPKTLRTFEHWKLRFEPKANDGCVTEISLRDHRGFLGVFVDPTLVNLKLTDPVRTSHPAAFDDLQVTSFPSLHMTPQLASLDPGDR